MNRRSLPLLVVASHAGLTACFAPGATYQLTGTGLSGTDINLAQATNWTATAGGTHAVPTSSDEAEIPSGFSTTRGLGFTTSAQAFGDLLINNTSSFNIGNSTTSTGNYSLTLGGGSSGSGEAIADGGAAGDLLLLGSAALTNTVNVGANVNGGTGTMPIVLGASGNFDVVNAGATLQINSAISGAFTLTKTGAGLLNLLAVNSYSGGTIISAGTLGLITSTNYAGTGSIQVLNGAALRTTDVNVYSTRTFTFGKLATDTTYADINTTSAGTLALESTVSVVGTLVKTGNGTLTIIPASTSALAPETIGTITINQGWVSLGVTTDSVGAVNIGTGTLVLNNNLYTSGSSFKVSAPIALNQSGSTIEVTTQTWVAAGTVSGTGALTKVGNGTLSLSGTNSYSGGTTINAGTLDAYRVAAIGTGSVTINAAAFQYNNPGFYSVTSFPMNFTLGSATSTINITNALSAITFAGTVSGTGGLTKTGSGTLMLGSTNSYSGGTTITTGTIGIANSNSLGTGSVVMNGGALYLQDGSAPTNPVLLSAATGTFLAANTGSFLGVVSGTGMLIKDGAGTIELDKANLYSGGTTVVNGTISLGNNTSLGSGSALLSGGALYLQGGTTVANAIALNANIGTLAAVNTGTVSGAISGISGYLLRKGNTGTIILTGSNSYAGGTYVGNGTLIGATAGAFGTGDLIVTPTISGLSQYNPVAVIAAGAVAPTANVTVSNYAVSGGVGRLIINDPQPTFASLSGTGNVILNNAAGTSLTVTPGIATTFSGIISETVAGKGSLTMAGIGTFTLSGNNTYSGGTSITNGIVQANGSASSLGTGATSVTGTGGVLAGTGATGGSVTVGLSGSTSANGTITGGSGASTSDSFGTLSTGAMTWTDHGTYVAKFAGNGSANDQLIMSGLTISASSPFTIQLGSGNGAASSSLSAGNYLIATDSINQPNVFADSSGNLVPGLVWNIGMVYGADGNPLALSEVDTGTSEQLFVVATPEPVGVSIVGMGGAVLLLKRRRGEKATLPSTVPGDDRVVN